MNLKGIILVVMLSTCPLFADTFTNKTTGEAFDGYKLSKTMGEISLIKTAKGVKKVNISDFTTERNSKGRSNKVTVIALDGPLQYEAETKAFNQSIIKASDRGSRFIIVKIDSPGGRLDLCRDMCINIDEVNDSDIYAFISGGKNGGAYSAAAAVALACDKNYMTMDTAIGAATPYMMTSAGIEEADPNMLKSFANIFYELAADKGRPGLLASAMVDKSVDVVEINQDGKSKFISLKNGNATNIVKTWTQEGSLLTMAAPDAQQTGICDELVEDIDELLVLLNAEDADVVQDKAPQKARREVVEAEKRINKTYARAQKKYRQFYTNKNLTYSQWYHKFNALIRDVKEAVALGEKYPDIYQHQHLPWLRDLLSELEAYKKKL